MDSPEEQGNRPARPRAEFAEVDAVVDVRRSRAFVPVGTLIAT
jgi:hypothetical protein